jgi:hypothetical protein
LFHLFDTHLKEATKVKIYYIKCVLKENCPNQNKSKHFYQKYIKVNTFKKYLLPVIKILLYTQFCTKYKLQDILVDMNKEPQSKHDHYNRLELP